MDYKKAGSDIYIRIDKGEKLVETILSVCQKEHILGGHFQGIGACDTATISTYIPEKQDFIHHTLSGMIEMISLTGNISADHTGAPVSHSHALFSWLKENGEVAVTAGHLKEARIGYTGEIVLHTSGMKIGRMFDPHGGIDVWDLQ